MTLPQCKYAVTVAEAGSMNEAARLLFISQPSLTAAIQELEREMGITIFLRTNRGVVLSREGDEFLGYARQVLMQAELLEEQLRQQLAYYNGVVAHIEDIARLRHELRNQLQTVYALMERGEYDHAQELLTAFAVPLVAGEEVR